MEIFITLPEETCAGIRNKVFQVKILSSPFQILILVLSLYAKVQAINYGKART